MAHKNKDGSSAALPNGTGTQAIDRALGILSCFDFAHPDWAVAEISDKLGLTIPTTQRILKALVTKKFLSQKGRTGRFELGLRVFELGSVVISRLNLVHQSKSILIRLRDETRETVHLVIVDGDEMLYVERVDSSDAFGVLSPVGLRRFLASGSLGKAILSTYSDSMVSKHLKEHDLIPYTPNSIIDRAVYIRELRKVRERGFAIDREELIHGICGVASPIRGEDGVALGGVAVAFPALRFDEARVIEWGKLVRQAGLTLSHGLSFVERAPTP
jgi:IclR family transcriptional regulator, KDG regulon repressor